MAQRLGTPSCPWVKCHSVLQSQTSLLCPFSTPIVLRSFVQLQCTPETRSWSCQNPFPQVQLFRKGMCSQLPRMFYYVFGPHHRGLYRPGFVAYFLRFCSHCLYCFVFSLLAIYGTNGFSDGPNEAAPESMQNQSRIACHIARQILVAFATRHNPKPSAQAVGQVTQWAFGFAIDNVKLRRAATCISIMKQYRALALPTKWITTIGIQSLRTF